MTAPARAQGRLAADPFKGTQPMFSSVAGGVEVGFAWLPRRCFDGRWVWLRPVAMRLCVVHGYLRHGGDTHWQYARLPRLAADTRARAEGER